MNNTIAIPAGHWHLICHKLGFNGVRTDQFQRYFKCNTEWKSNLDNDTGPVMILKFENPADLTIFALGWL